MDLLITFAVVLIPLIVIHEFGHFLACKMVGITVLEFGLGFPPRAAKLFDWGETEFTLNWLPIGGFVRPYGEDFVRPQSEEEMAKVKNEELEQRKRKIENPKSVFEAKPLEKIVFLLAGPVANLIAALVIFFVLALTGLPREKSDVTVSELFEDLEVATTQLQSGDIIREIDGEKIESTLDFDDAVEDAAGVSALTVQRGEETLKYEMPLVELTDVPIDNRLIISTMGEGYPAEKAGLQPGDELLTINGESIPNLEFLQEKTQENENIEVILHIRRDGELMDIPVTPKRVRLSGEDYIGIGITIAARPVVSGFVVADKNIVGYTEYYGVVDAAKYSWNRFTAAVDLMFLRLPRMLIRGEIGLKEARPVSPVGISQIGSQILQENPYQDFVMFIGLISIALAVTNLLPIPALDGGRIMFVLVEIIRGKPIPPEREGIVHLISIGLLLSLMVILVINDVINPVSF